MIDKDFLNRLKTSTNASLKPEESNYETKLKDEIFVLHLASDLKTGLLREIDTLVDLGYVRINRSGLPTLLDGWEKKIHPFILTEMWETGWSAEVDNENKFCIDVSIRDAIEAEWKYSSECWISRSNPAIRHNHDEYEYSRHTFEGGFEDLMNEVDGIAQFGI